MKLPNEISKNILTIGCEYRPVPKGGVAQVLQHYGNLVYPNFKFIANSGEGSKLRKLWIAITSLLMLMWKCLVDKDIKIVHIHTASYNSFRRSAWFLRIAKMMHRKVILHIHGGGFKDYYATDREWVAKILNKADGLIVLSEYWKEFFKKIVPSSRVVVVENIIDYPQKREVEKDGKLHLLFLGLIADAKGIFDLLDVLREHKGEFNGRLVLHVGGNGEVDRFNKFVAERDLDGLVSYEGWVSGDKKVDLLNLCDLYILPSYAEGVPLSILEAMSYDMAIVASNVGGIPELVNETNGILFNPGDKDAIYQSLKTLLDSSEKLDNLKSNASKGVEVHYADVVEKRLEKIYKELL
jgi:glycosyltransferase involved in cell wall biosynthesis